jgi:hypothetical protein
MKSVVFAFGRMNPPTTGHQLLVNKLVAYARQIGAAPRVYLSHSVGVKDPLNYDKKIAFARAAFGSIVKKSNARTVIEVLKSLEKEGYTQVTMFAGSDRVPEFTKLITKYNGKEYNFDKIEVKSAGERDPDADDVSGMSASKMRALAKDEKLPEFIKGAPHTLKASQAKDMYNAVRRALLGEDVMVHGINEMFIEFIIESDEPTISMPSDADMAKHIESMSDEELDLDDSDILMLDVIVGQDIEKEDVSEARVLSIQTRQKLSQRMKGMSKRLARLRQIKAKTMPAQQRLRMRARKAAIMMLRKRATGKKDLDYNSLSKNQRVAVDNALVNRFGKSLNSAVDKLSKRIMPMIRKKAQTNVAKARDVNESFIYEDKGKEGTTSDVKSDIKQAKKRGISVSDWEKSKADKAHDSPLNIDPTKLDNLKIDPQGNDRSAPNPTTGHLHQNRKLMHYARSVDEGRKSASDKDARDAGDTNIIYQMRKTINSRGEHETTFADGHKAHISVNDAKKMLAKFEALRLPADKHSFTVAAGKSLQAFRNVMSHGIPKDKPKISLGGRQFNEFYLGVGRARTVSPYDRDEPPGTRNIGEIAKDEQRPTDPNQARPLSQKLDLLLRLGLSDQEELQKYRRALRSSKKHALQSPQMREALANLLDKLIDLTTKDPATYSRVRYNVMNKEANSLLRKAEDSGVPVEIIYEVFARGFEINNNINEAFNRVNSFIAGGKAADLDSDLSEKVKAPTGNLKDACWSGYTAVGMKMKNGRKVPNCVPKEGTATEAKSNWDKQARFAKYDTISSRGSQKKAYVDRNYTPMKTDLAKDADAVRNAFLAKGGTIQKIEPGKKTIKSYVKPKKYMTPNQASRVTEGLEGAKGADATKKLADYYKKNKSIVKADESYTGSEPVSKDKNDPANRFVGTDSIVQNYADATPGQKKPIKESVDLNESFAAGFQLAPFARDYGIHVQSSYAHSPDVQEQLDAMEATYKGKTVPLNKPMKGDVKKSKVYVDPDGDGKAKKVNFGDKKLSIKKDQPARKRSYCARSGGQGNLTNKSSANYWSRRAWDC